MSQENNNSKIVTMSELFASASATASEGRKNGTLKLSELKKEMKTKAKLITQKKDELYVVLEQLEGQELLCLQAKQHCQLAIAEIEEEYKERTEAYNLYTVDVAEGLATVVISKASKPIAPITRGIAQALRSAKKELIG